MRISAALGAAILLTFSVLAPGAHAQGRGKPQVNTSGSKDSKPKADEKAYQDALKRIPEKKIDPWGTMR